MVNEKDKSSKGLEYSIENEDKQLYVLSARGTKEFSQNTAGMELVAELARQKRSIDLLFFDTGSGSLALRYCSNKGIQTEEVPNYETVLKKLEKNRGVFAYLTDKENGELKRIAEEARKKGISPQLRTRTKY